MASEEKPHLKKTTKVTLTLGEHAASRMHRLEEKFDTGPTHLFRDSMELVEFLTDDPDYEIFKINKKTGQRIIVPMELFI